MPTIPRNLSSNASLLATQQQPCQLSRCGNIATCFPRALPQTSAPNRPQSEQFFSRSCFSSLALPWAADGTLKRPAGRRHVSSRCLNTQRLRGKRGVRHDRLVFVFVGCVGVLMSLLSNSQEGRRGRDPTNSHFRDYGKRLICAPRLPLGFRLPICNRQSQRHDRQPTAIFFFFFFFFFFFGFACSCTNTNRNRKKSKERRWG